MAGEIQQPPQDLRALDWSAALRRTQKCDKKLQKARRERKYELERKIKAYKDRHMRRMDEHGSFLRHLHTIVALLSVSVAKTGTI